MTRCRGRKSTHPSLRPSFCRPCRAMPRPREEVRAMPTVPYAFRFRVTAWMAAKQLIPLDRLPLLGMMRLNRLHTINGPEDERFSRQQLALFAGSAAFAFGAGYLAMRLATQRQ